MPRSPRLGLRAQIVLALSLVFLLSFWLLGFATLQITRRSAEAERARAEELLARALAPELVTAQARSDASMRGLCQALQQRVALTGLRLLRSDGTHFECGEQRALGRRSTTTLRDGDQLSLRLPAPSEHIADAIANLLLFYMAITGLAVALLAYVLLTYLIVRPLERLTLSAEHFALGAEHVSVKEQGSAEAMRLARTFNEMARLLKAERKQLTDRLAELERTTGELRRTERQLIDGEKLASVGRLAAGVAHEIGNPLAAILGLLELLRGGDLSAAQQAEFLGRVSAETERINGIIRDLLDFARHDAESDELQETADLRDVIRDAVSLLRPQKESKDIAIEVAVDQAVRPVLGPQRRLTQIVLNLLLNALDALDGAGKVEIRVQVSPDDKTVVLSVLDDGPGIAPSIEHTLFDPFTTTKAVGKGTGLGLAVTHAIVDALQGTIEARNRPEGGACFEVRLRQIPPSSMRAAV
jgi:C4-dicarboxylate-specific signal transduction histidine kinase